MGKGQRLRREQDAAATPAPIAGLSALRAPQPLSVSSLPVPPKPAVSAANPLMVPASKPVVVSPVKSNVVSAPSYSSIFQQTDGIEQFLAMDETERLNKVEELLEQARIAHTPSPQPIAEPSKSTPSISTMKTSQSMQSLSTSVGTMKLGSSNQQDPMKHARSSNSLQDLNKPQQNAPKTDTSLVESIIFDLTAILKGCGITSLEGHRIVSAMRDQVMSDDKIEKGLILMKSLLNILDKVVEPFVFPLVPRLLSLHADRSPMVRALAAEILDVLAGFICPYSIFSLYEMFEPCMKDDIDWRIKVAALQMLKTISPRVTGLISSLLPRMIPQISECIIDTRKQVQTLAIETLTAACSAIHNEDVVHLVPQLIRVIAFAQESVTTLDMLLETTFVAMIDAPTLALITPLLGKSLKGRQSQMKRKAARVIENMCKLVNDPANVAPFMPLLLPSLNKVIEEVTDEEVCQVATSARDVLMKAMGSVETDPITGNVILNKPNSLPDITVLKPIVLEVIKNGLVEEEDKFNLKMQYSDELLDYMAFVLCSLLEYQSSLTMAKSISNSFGPEQQWMVAVSYTTIESWRNCFVPYLKACLDREKCEDVETLHQLAQILRKKALGSVPDMQVEEENDDTSLCNIYFSLAFGGKTLLHNTYLRLGKGKRYGIMGKNGTGKTTLLTNIASGNIEGLPTALRTVYVQHDDSSDDMGIPLIDELLNNPNIQAVNVAREEAVSALKSINFTDEMLQTPRNSLSGGWKMKLLIIRAMLLKADVLLLDEPTNHLDAESVRWLGDYLVSQPTLTCMIVSHDTGFLDRVVTDVIHYEQRKLVYYHGTLSQFVAIHPESKYYFDLESSTLKFIFPVPERLEGINSATKSVLKLDDVTFTYPGASKPTIRNAHVKLCLGSRVAVIGPNGAGKSTLIKLIVKETEPDVASDGVSRCGEVWKHHNLRVAYVAQHSLHHVEQHLEKSPVDYIKWRFEKGFDKEEVAKSSMSFTEEELDNLKAERKYGDVLEIHGRRKNGRTMEYECSFVGQTQYEENKYIALEDLIEQGLEKLVQQADTRIAAMAAGIDVRPLLTKEIQRHLDDFNLESEYGTHSKIRRLSGGQKVKLVLAAAMWNRPHIIVLDEPTNYLDREAMGALTQAIKEFHGGIVIISHNADFTNSICTERWLVKDGQVSVEGEAEDKTIKATSSRKIKAENKALETPTSEKNSKVGNINGAIASAERIKNPRTFEYLKPVEIRKLTKLSTAAGMSLKDYVAKLNPSSPEWKWL